MPILRNRRELRMSNAGGNFTGAAAIVVCTMGSRDCAMEVVACLELVLVLLGEVVKIELAILW